MTPLVAMLSSPDRLLARSPSPLTTHTHHRPGAQIGDTGGCGGRFQSSAGPGPLRQYKHWSLGTSGPPTVAAELAIRERHNRNGIIPWHLHIALDVDGGGGGGLALQSII